MDNPFRLVRERVQRWWHSRLPLTDTWTLGQRNIYIVPTKAGFAFALTDGKLRASFATKATQTNHPWLEPKVRALAEVAEDARQMLNAIERAEDAVAALALALKLDEAYAEG